MNLSAFGILINQHNAFGIIKFKSALINFVNSSQVTMHPIAASIIVILMDKGV